MRYLLCLTALVLTAVGLWEMSAARGFQVFGEIVPRVARPDSVVALTFDDGPTPPYTDSVLALLAGRGVRATFFVTGRETEAHPVLARRIVAAGHELGNHSYTHPRLLLKTPGRVRDELDRTDAAIRAAGHTGPIYFRPPYGKKLFVLPWVLARSGRTTVTWDIEPESYPDVARSAERIAAHVVERARPGSIVLLHLMYESRRTSRAALPLVIDGLRARGYRFVPLSELLGDAG